MKRLLCVLVLFVGGCNGIGIQPIAAPDPITSVSPRTLQTLRGWDLEQHYPHDPLGTIRRLHAVAAKDSRADLLYALAELCWLQGRSAECRSCGEALPFYYLCAGYAYHYLYGNEGGSPFDPRFRLACDLYNAGLAQCIRAAQVVGRLDPSRELVVPMRDGAPFTLTVSHHGFVWKPEEFGPLLLCEDYRSEGLVNQHRTFGLGVPLIASRASFPKPEADPGLGLYPPGVSFPVTAFFRFEGTLADLYTRRAGRLELHNPLSVQSIAVKGIATPLETDTTTPLAHFLERADLEKYGVRGFLRPDSVRGVSNVWLVEPYRPGKIPILFVHGLLSSPATWAPLYNDLLADPRVREKYQFWFYLYPTANPYFMTAADLRHRLQLLRERLDPQRKDAALDDMVLVGHSMGGLISKLLTTSSGDEFWRLYSNEPFENFRTSPEAKRELERVFFFERQPSVKRVIYLGTPHHGSRLSPSLPGRILRYFVRLPKELATTAKDMTRGKSECVPISLDLLAPGAPALELLASLPRAAEVKQHSIVGVAPTTTYVKIERLLAGARTNEKGDGVVPYSSAHLADVESELIVPAEHTEVHHHPLAVQEVRRILLEHGGR